MGGDIAWTAVAQLGVDQGAGGTQPGRESADLGRVLLIGQDRRMRDLAARTRGGRQRKNWQPWTWYAVKTEVILWTAPMLGNDRSNLGHVQVATTTQSDDAVGPGPFCGLTGLDSQRYTWLRLATVKDPQPAKLRFELSDKVGNGWQTHEN